MVLYYSRKALKFLGQLDKKSVGRIQQAIHRLTEIPPQGDIKPMQGYSDGRKRLRVGNWRIIFRYGTEGQIEVLTILDIGNRGDVYK